MKSIRILRNLKILYQSYWNLLKYQEIFETKIEILSNIVKSWNILVKFDQIY